MALLRANQSDVLEAMICLPRLGVWHADLKVDTPDALTGPITLTVDAGLTFQGTAVRTGEFVDTNHLRVVGGAGGLGGNASPKHYTSTTVEIILGDLLGGAGETFSGTADSGILATGVDAWTTTASPVGTLVTKLLAAVAPTASWRVLPDGTVWIGVETWPDLALDPATYQILEDEAAEARMVVAVERPALTAGTTFEHRKVSYVEHHVGLEGDIRMTVYFEEAAIPSDVDRLKASLAALVRAAPVKIDYRARYWARVIQQSGGTIDVQPEIPGVPDMARVPLFSGLPGAKIDAVLGGRVLVGWSGADPSKAFAESFDADTSVQKLVLAATQLFLGGEIGAEPTIKALTFMTAMTTMLTALAAYVAAIKTIADPTNVATPPLLTAITAFEAAAASFTSTHAQVL